MGKTIAIVNQKGGVGKTTSGANRPAALTAQGAKVLVCDFDPQGNATSGFGLDKSRSPSVYDVVLGDAPMSKAVVSTKWGDVVPANKALSGATVELFALARRKTPLRKSKTGTISFSSTAPPPWSCSPWTGCVPPTPCWCPCSANTTPWRG